MAAIASTAVHAEGNRWSTYTWTAVTEADSFTPIAINAKVTDLIVQFGGTFGGSTVVLNGSLDGTTYAGLPDLAGSAISVTAAGMKEAGARPVNVQPSASGGTSQSLTVIVFVRYAHEGAVR